MGPRLAFAAVASCAAVAWPCSPADPSPWQDTSDGVGLDCRGPEGVRRGGCHTLVVTPKRGAKWTIDLPGHFFPSELTVLRDGEMILGTSRDDLYVWRRGQPQLLVKPPSRLTERELRMRGEQWCGSFRWLNAAALEGDRLALAVRLSRFDEDGVKMWVALPGGQLTRTPPKVPPPLAERVAEIDATTDTEARRTRVARLVFELELTDGAEQQTLAAELLGLTARWAQEGRQGDAYRVLEGFTSLRGGFEQPPPPEIIEKLKGLVRVAGKREDFDHTIFDAVSRIAPAHPVLREIFDTILARPDCSEDLAKRVRAELATLPEASPPKAPVVVSAPAPKPTAAALAEPPAGWPKQVPPPARGKAKADAPVCACSQTAGAFVLAALLLAARRRRP